MYLQGSMYEANFKKIKKPTFTQEALTLRFSILEKLELNIKN